MKKNLTDNDKQLIELAQAGDINAFAELVKKHEIKVRAFLAVRLANQYESYDLAQDTFIVAFNKLSEFKSERPFGPWLKGIAYHLLKNYWRKHRAVLVGTNDELEMLIDEHIHFSFSDNQDSDSLAALESCVKKLDEKSKNLVNQHYVSEKSVSDLTKEYEVAHSTMTMRLHRIRSKLKACIDRTLTMVNT